jgi:hypothetical protein
VGHRRILAETASPFQIGPSSLNERPVRAEFASS